MEPQNQQFEQQLKDVHEEAMRRKEEYENSGAEQEKSHDRNALHEVVGERLGKESKEGFSQGGANPDPQNTQSDTGEDVNSYELPELKEKVQDLVNTAFTKDIESAIEEAKKQENPALLDAFHDALVDHLYEHLVERGKLERM